MKALAVRAGIDGPATTSSLHAGAIDGVRELQPPDALRGIAVSRRPCRSR